MSAAMELRDVVFSRGGAEILSGVSLDVQTGEVVALVGPSGAGKTSVLRALLGLLVPQRGAVLLHGAAATRDGLLLLPPEERRLAIVFQDLALWPHMTVHGNLEFGLASQGVPRGEREHRIAGMLERVGLTGKERRYPDNLSGGERQRVAIARALVLEPRGVLLDEPLANLDVVSKRELGGMFRELLHERRASAIYVTHDPREAALLGDRIAVLEQGRIVQVDDLNGLRWRPATPFIEALVSEHFFEWRRRRRR